jgi:hypothetical protein
MAKQKKIEDLKFNYDIEVALKCLWAIRKEDEFYFMEYGKDWLNKIVEQRLLKNKKPVIKRA